MGDVTDEQRKAAVKATPAFRRNKAHTVYLLADGKRVPGTTTITGLLDRSRYLIPWANNLGLQGINASDYRDSMAGIGTLAHAMAQGELSGQPISEDLTEYSMKEISLAENAMIKFLDWRKAHDFKPILIEKPLVSEQHRYGGTIDAYGMLDGAFTLIDLKTSGRLYDDMKYQLAAYRQLLVENGYPVDNARIVRIGRDESEGFEEQIFGGLDNAWQVFWHLRQVYELTKKTGGE